MTINVNLAAHVPVAAPHLGLAARVPDAALHRGLAERAQRRAPPGVQPGTAEAGPQLARRIAVGGAAMRVQPGRRRDSL